MPRPRRRSSRKYVTRSVSRRQSSCYAGHETQRQKRAQPGRMRYPMPVRPVVLAAAPAIHGPPRHGNRSGPHVMPIQQPAAAAVPPPLPAYTRRCHTYKQAAACHAHADNCQWTGRGCLPTCANRPPGDCTNECQWDDERDTCAPTPPPRPSLRRPAPGTLRRDTGHHYVELL